MTLYSKNTRALTFLHLLAPKDLSFSGLLQSLRKKDNNLFSVLYGYFLATVSEKLEVVPGCEFRAAYEEAQRLVPKAQVRCDKES